MKTESCPQWISVNTSLPKLGKYMVRFLIEVLSKGANPYEDISLLAEGEFEPSQGWYVRNRYIRHFEYQQPYQSPKMRVTHWMPLIPLPESE